MKSFFNLLEQINLLEGRVPFKTLVSDLVFNNTPPEDRSNLIAYQEIGIGLDKLEEEGFLDKEVNLRYCVELKNGLEQAFQYERSLNQRVKSIVLLKSPTGPMQPYKQIRVYDTELIEKLCAFLNISFNKNAKIYLDNETDHFYSIKPEHLMQAINDVLNREEIKEILNQPLIGRNKSNMRRVKLNDRMIPKNWLRIINSKMPDQNGYYNYDVLLMILSIAYNLSTGRRLERYRIPNRFFIF